jgi:hypothetical protein
MCNAAICRYGGFGCGNICDSSPNFYTLVEQPPYPRFAVRNEYSLFQDYGDEIVSVVEEMM